MKKKFSIAGIAVIVFVFGFLSGAFWMSNRFISTYGPGSLSPDTEEPSRYISDDSLWAYQFFGGMYKSEERMKAAPKGKGILQIRINRDGTPVAGVGCKMFLNGKFKTGEQITNAKGILSFNLPEAEWYINAIQCDRWSNKPEGEFMLVVPGQRTLSKNEGEFIPGLNEMGEKVTVDSKAPSSPHLSLELNKRIAIVWPARNGQKQEASIAKSNISWEPYPEATEYIVKVHHVTRKGNSATYVPVVHRKVKGSTSFPLSQLAHTRDVAAKDEYAVTVEAYAGNGDFLSESQSFDGTFTLTDGYALIEDEHGVYGSVNQDVVDNLYREQKIIESVETMIKEKMYVQAEALLSKVTSNELKGKKDLMTGYLFASKGDCKKANVAFEEAQNKVDCVPEAYRGKCK